MHRPTKGYSNDKAVSLGKPTALPSSPIRAVTASLGCRTSSAGTLRTFTFRPDATKRDVQSDKPKLWTCDGFFAASFRISRFRCGKRKAPTPLNVSRPRWRAFVFCRCRWGTGTAKARALTTPPLDAENVTHSRKICDAPSSPRFALFYMATL
jgi:hypothetical protein